MDFTLLRDYSGSPCEGWLMSPKADGWRCGWNGSDFILRGGGVLRVPDHWKVGMPGFALDGELFAGAGGFNAIQGRIARGFHGLSFEVFDAPAALPFRRRLAFLKTLVLPPHCGLVEHVRCRDTQHLVEFADQVVMDGGEGAVVRDPKAPYVAGRSWAVQRWVPQCPRLNRRKVAA